MCVCIHIIYRNVYKIIHAWKHKVACVAHCAVKLAFSVTFGVVSGLAV